MARTETERGNLFLTQEDSYGRWNSILFVIREDKVVQQISFFPEDYPSWHVRSECSIDVKEIVEHINRDLQGWVVRKNNVDGINIGPDGVVMSLDLEDKTGV